MPRIEEELERQWKVQRDIMNAKKKREEKQIPELTVLPNKEREFQKPFKLNYETEEEIHLRLKNSIIIINNNPFYVYDFYRKDKERYLQVFDHVNAWFLVNFNDPNLDLRCCPPSYIYDREVDRVYYMNRRAEQGIYRQGHVTENTLLYRVGTYYVRSPDNRGHLMNLLCPQKDKRYTEEIEKEVKLKGLAGIRLTKDIALYYKRNIQVEYKGRYLAELQKGKVNLRKEDIKPWIIEKLQEANLPL